VLSDWLVVRIGVNPGETFLDRMIGMVEGAKRQKTPNEIALTILLVALTLTCSCWPRRPCCRFDLQRAGQPAGTPVIDHRADRAAGLPDPHHHRRPAVAIGVAGMGRMMAKNVIATSGRAVEAAGDVDVLLLDKTGTITLGNRQATAFLPAPGVTAAELADGRAARVAGRRDPGRAAASSCWPSRSSTCAARRPGTAPVRPLHRADPHERRRLDGPRQIRKGAATRSASMSNRSGGTWPGRRAGPVDDIARRARRRWWCATLVTGAVARAACSAWSS
jgi:K+-transporting ATPase ATPase B chain